MATWTVAPTGGDYTSLAAALSNASTVAGDTIEIDGDWTGAPDTSAAAVNDNNLTITVLATATAYKLQVSSGAHCLTVNNSGLVFDLGGSGEIVQASTTTSAEAVRVATSGTTTIRNGKCRATTTTSQQDGIYCGNQSCTIVAEQMDFIGFYRGGIHVQSFASGNVTVVLDVNSCAFWDNGHNTVATTGTHGGGVVCSPNGAVAASFTINIHNSWAVDNTNGTAGRNGDYHQSGSNGTITWGISYSVDGDNSIASRDGGGAGNLASRSIAESTGGGDEILATDITTSPYDLSPVDDATNNDLQAAHSVNTAEGLTIPGTDADGETRSTPHEIGPRIVVAGGTTVTPAAAGTLASAVNPSVVLGSVSLTPAVAPTLASAIDPTAVLGSLSVMPEAAPTLASAVNPIVAIIDPPITPAAAETLASAVDPAVQLGSLAVTPAAAATLASAVDPVVDLGSINLTPGAAGTLASAVDPTVDIGGAPPIVPAPAETLASAVNPTLFFGSTSVTPGPASTRASAANPIVVGAGPGDAFPYDPAYDISRDVIYPVVVRKS